jgi:hypothetical protein
MAPPKKRPERTRHPTMWTVEVVRWQFREHESEYQRLLAKKREKGPGVQLGQQIKVVDVTDRAFALAVARHFLDRHIEEAVGPMSLEVHIYAPERELQDESLYQVTDEVLDQARQLGLEGDVEKQVQRMARDGTPYTHPQGNVRHGRFVLKLEGMNVTRIALVDLPHGPRQTK